VDNREINGRGTSQGIDQHYGVPAMITSKNLTRTQKCLAKKPLEDQDRDGRIILKLSLREKLVAVHWNSDTESIQRRRTRTEAVIINGKGLLAIPPVAYRRAQQD
jgi:hypothetical protein